MVRLSNKFLMEARSELDKYIETKDVIYLRQASEKGWGSMAQALKALAYPKELKSHADLLNFGFRQSSSIKTGTAFGNTLHSSGFYEGILTYEAVKSGLEYIREAVEASEKELKAKLSANVAPSN